MGSGYSWPVASESQSHQSSCERGVYVLLWGYVTCFSGLPLFILMRTEGESVVKVHDKDY